MKRDLLFLYSLPMHRPTLLKSLQYYTLEKINISNYVLYVKLDFTKYCCIFNNLLTFLNTT